MARPLAKLSARRVSTLKEPGRHSDGGGLYLVVDPSGAKRWVFLFRWREGGVGPGRLREMGLGSLAAVPLEKARRRAAVARELVADGRDPIAAKHATREIPTFGAVADDFIASRTRQVESDKSVARLNRALKNYAAALRPLRIDQVTTERVLATLLSKPSDDENGLPFWERVPPSAKMTLGYIEAVLDSAKARGLRSGDNPARWRGHLEHVLPKPKKLGRGHHAAMACADVPGFFESLQEGRSSTSLALGFLILTAARTGEVLGASWTEIDLENSVWTVPASRMKARREHRVPLSSGALQVLGEIRALDPENDGLVFRNQRNDRALSSMTFDMLLRRRGLDVTTHGFRSAFRDWAGEITDFPSEIAEAALAHVAGNEAVRAYRRGDALEKRRAMMEEWSRWCRSGTANLVSFPRQSTAR